jgi:hypothetical protein
MSKKNDRLTDFDKQLIAGMKEVVAHINSSPATAARRSLSLPTQKRSGKSLA